MERVNYDQRKTSLSEKKEGLSTSSTLGGTDSPYEKPSLPRPNQ